MTSVMEVIVFGVGGHGRECGGIVRALEAAGEPIRLLGFVDDAPADIDLDRAQRIGADFLGRLEAAVATAQQPVVTLGIGSGPVRRRLAERVDALGLHSPSLVHPEATIGLDVTLDPGATVFAGARLTTNIRLGRHAHVNQGVTIGHDCVIDDFATVNPGAAVSGMVHVGTAATVGAGAVVLQGRTVGPNASVGASACVIRDVLPDVVVKGVPAT